MLSVLVARTGGSTVAELPTGTVTFLFTDLESSTRLWEQDPEAMHAALARHDELLREAVEARGGQVIKGTGDGLHAVFSTAEGAVVAAVDGQLALGGEPWGSVGPLRVRMGLHTGVAEQRAGDYFGPVLNRAARLMSVAHAGQVLCSQATADLVRDCLPPSMGLVELGVHRLRDLDRPEVVFQVEHSDLRGEFPALATADGVVGNLPRRVTSFVGHEEDLSVIAAELERTSVVTLTGVGGVGKTRLALEVANLAAPGYRDGAWLCELAGVRHMEAVAEAVLETFGVESSQGASTDESLRDFLRAKELVVVLDNCEHLLKPVARLVSDIVGTCPGIRVLATSREGLGVAGERILVVASLPVPEATDDVEVIAASEAVRLFVERARAVRTGFTLDAANADAVAQVCQRLDGVPLAIELAAARVAMLTPVELASRLDQRFRVLTGSGRGVVERHQTLRAAIDWSYDLLEEGERRLLDRLSVFVGGFSFAGAEMVAAATGIEVSEVFDLLAGLVARSLVVADTEGVEARYRLLETIRQYASERLATEDDTRTVRDAHAHYYVGFAEDGVAGLMTPRASDWARRIVEELDNLRGALAWVIESGDSEMALRFFELDEAWFPGSELADVLFPAAGSALSLPSLTEDTRYPTVLACAAHHANAQGDLEAMRQYCDDAVAAQARLGVGPTLSVTAACMNLASAEGSVDEMITQAEIRVALLRARGDTARLAGSLSSLALARSLKGEDLTVAIREVEEALMLAEPIAVPFVMAAVLANAAFVLADTQPERARVLMHDTIRIKTLHASGIGPLQSMLGDVAERLGDDQLALEYFVTGLEDWHWRGHSELVGRMLRRIGLLLADPDPETAAVLIGAGLARSRAATLTERAFAAQERGIQALGDTLGEDRCRDLRRQGAAMGERDAVLLAHSAAAKVLSADHP